MFLRVYFVIILLLSFQVPVFSDTIKLKNGKVIENVKTEIQSESVIITSNTGKTTYPKSAVLTIKLKPVSLSKDVTSSKKEISSSELTAERIRIAELLQNQFDWETELGEKPRLAVLNFQAGTGVSSGELDTIIEIITTNLVKTNLFEVVDRQTIEAMKREQEKYNDDCKKGLKDCTNKLGELVRANRILTGKITKIESRYFINGYIVDPIHNKLDFAESEIATNTSNIPVASETFAKKIAGGVMEYYDVEYKSKISIQNFSFIKKSAIFPGYGQYSYAAENQVNLQKYKAYTFGGITAGLIIFNLIQYQNYLSDLDKYKESQTILLLSWSRPVDAVALLNEEEKHQNFIQSKRDSQSAMLLLASVYFLNLIDAYFLPARNREESSKSTYLKFNASQSGGIASLQQRENIITAEYGINF